MADVLAVVQGSVRDFAGLVLSRSDGPSPRWPRWRRWRWPRWPRWRRPGGVEKAFRTSIFRPVRPRAILQQREELQVLTMRTL